MIEGLSKPIIDRLFNDMLKRQIEDFHQRTIHRVFQIE